MTGCEEKDRTRHPPFWEPGRIIGVIGGRGEMGRLFSDFFRQCGYKVIAADVGAPPDAREVIEASDMVLFAVPLHRTVPIIRDLLPYVHPRHLLMDLSSLKVAPVKEMLRSSSQVLGLHPMFGGRISSFEGQTLVACPVRIEREAWEFLRGLFTRMGIKVKECTPEEHDRMMSVIQVLFHMTTMLTGRVLRELGVDISDTLEYTSPSYRLEINLLGRIFAQNPALYSAITQMNPYTRNILTLLKEGLESYENWYGSENLEGFIEDFRKSADHLGPFCRTAYQESSAYLDYVTRSFHAHSAPKGGECAREAQDSS